MADGFTEDQIAIIRAREKHARDIAQHERDQAERFRAQHRRGEPTPATESSVLANIADILAEHGVQAARRPTFEERIAPRALSPQERTGLLRQRLRRDVPHVAREQLFDVDGNRVQLRETKALRGARFWRERKRRKGVLFTGNVGAGKTLAAALLALEHLEANPLARVCWLHATQLVGAVVYPGQDDKVPSLSGFTVVDDIGRELHSPETFAEALAQLVEMAEVHTVVLTSNNLASEFRARYDGPEAVASGVPGRLTSRLNGYVTAIDCVGDDLRGRSGGF